MTHTTDPRGTSSMTDTTDSRPVTVPLWALDRFLSYAAADDGWSRTGKPELGEAWDVLMAAKDAALGHPVPAAAQEPQPPARTEGQFMQIAFMGHVELAGYVTEITLGGEPGYHIDLPERLWGGNPLAWEEYSAKALYSRRPVTEASVRAAWDAQVRRAAERRQQDAEQERQQQERAVAAADLRELPAGDEFTGGHADETAPF